MAFVAVDAYTATLASMPHLSIFHANPSLLGDSLAQHRSAISGTGHVLLLDLVSRCYALLDGWGITTRRVRVQPAFDDAQHPQHDHQGSFLLAWVIPI